MPYVAAVDLAGADRRRLAERGQSQHRAALIGGLPQDAVRSVVSGRVPRLNRLEHNCGALSLELFTGPPLDVQVEAKGAETSRRPTRLDASIHLPMQAISQPSPELYLRPALPLISRHGLGSGRRTRTDDYRAPAGGHPARARTSCHC